MAYYGKLVVGNFRKKTKKPPRVREGNDTKYLDRMRRLPSCVSGKPGAEPHHLRLKEERGIGQKATDRWALPLTREEHTFGADCVHSVGARLEEEWFLERGVRCWELAEKLWALHQAGAADQELVAEILVHRSGGAHG
jgi:hypothetical protein